MKRHAILGALTAIAVASPAAAQTIDVSPVADGAVIAGALVGTWAMFHLPVTKSRWEREPFAFDARMRGTFSSTHDMLGDALIATTIVTPIVAGALRSDSELLEKGVVYAEVLSVSTFLNVIAKFSVQRPRPYSYSTDPNVVRYTEGEGSDAYLSFFSGHSSSAFAAATSGAYLFAYGNSNIEARAFVWGFEMAFASATATSRVRAGKHFPSDVLLGAAVGAGVGILVPRAHMSDRGAVHLEPAEWAAIGGGLVLGTATAALLPAFPFRKSATFSLVPSLSPTGFSMRGTF